MERDEMAEKRLEKALVAGLKMLQTVAVTPDWVFYGGVVHRLGEDGRYHPTDEDIP